MTPQFKACGASFHLMEEAQGELLRRLNISLFDRRLRRSREQALALFEQAWPMAIRKGMITSEKDAAPLYIHCLARALSSVGIVVPKEFLPRDEKIVRFLQEDLS